MLAKELIAKYNRGACSPKERAIVERWFESELQKQAPVQSSPQRLKIIRSNMPWMVHSKIRTINYHWWAIASCLILSLLISSLYLWNSSTDNFDPSAEVFSKRASITLANGHQVTLDNSFNKDDSTLLSQNGLKWSIDGILRLSEPTISSTESTETLTRIETPQGGEYKIELSDGTIVQLNSASILEFPISFMNNERQVKLIGEAYFDVTKNKERPFIINAANKMGIKVLGTSFNVSTHDSKVNTTLIEGRVEVTRFDNAKSIIMTPGETASMSDNGEITVDRKDLNQILAWKKGYFNFNNYTIEEVSIELERWYAITVEVAPSISGTKFYGEFERKQPLSDVMKLLENTGIKVELRGRRLKLSAH